MSKTCKQKTHKASKKRFSILGNGNKIKASSVGKRHCMIKRTPKIVRNKSGTSILDKSLFKKIFKYFNLHQ